MVALIFTQGTLIKVPIMFLSADLLDKLRSTTGAII